MQPQKANNDGVSDAYPILVQERIARLREFKRWVTHEVLPAIRKTGMYATPATVEAMLANPDTMIQVLQAFKDEREQRLALETKVVADAPKVAFADAVETSTDSCLVGQLAKIIRQNGYEIGANRLVRIDCLSICAKTAIFVGLVVIVICRPSAAWKLAGLRSKKVFLRTPMAVFV